MKDLDDLLPKQTPKPKRPLSANFTESVLQGMKQEEQSLWQTIAGSLHIRHLSGAGVAALLAVVLIGGSVAAFSLWPSPSVTPTVKKLTPSGNRIVGYDVNNCLYLDALDGRKPEFKSEKIYYEVHKDSKLTDAQIQEGIRAICEENVSNNAVSALVKQLPDNLPGMQSTLAYTITGISGTSISVSPDSHYSREHLTVQASTKYTRFAKDLMVYNQDTETSYKDLAVGDTIKLVVQDTSGKSSEAPPDAKTSNDWRTDTEPYNALNHPEHIIILGIVKIPALTGDPNVIMSAYATDIVRLEPCDNSETGLCRVYDFAQ